MSIIRTCFFKRQRNNTSIRVRHMDLMCHMFAVRVLNKHSIYSRLRKFERKISAAVSMKKILMYDRLINDNNNQPIKK